ncbi:MAG: flippase-like domain-containing protein [Lachnospiraceae bacterium]|nr:flippase-like domain-containing protein [Lachnospiraceae bacterium]
MLIKLLLAGTLCLIWFLVIHTVKMFRMYLLLLESRIEFRRFIFAYCRTTLINLAIPFKLGEIYRMAVFSRITKSAPVGIASVVVDRFFDTLALVLILLPLSALSPSGISAVSVFLMVFVAVVIFVYIMFPSAYGYLNKYIIINRTSARSMTVLRWLEILNSGYEYVKRLVTGRYALLTLMSFGAWVLEGGLLFLISRLLGLGFGMSEFSDYITSIMSAAHSELQQKYTIFSIALMLLLSVITGIMNYSAYKHRRATGFAGDGSVGSGGVTG